MTLGQKIKHARIEKGLTQKELVGDQITRNMLSKIENGSATPSVKTLEYLAGRLGLTVSYLMSDLTYSDGTSPDGLDDMRKAYREKRYDDCIELLENSQTAGTTDEGYLLRSLADLAAARQAADALDFEKAKEHADSADYYNKQGLYYFAEIDAEMSLILAECANVLDSSEFEYNASEFRRAVNAISFSLRYELAKADHLIQTNKIDEALSLLDSLPEPDDQHLLATVFYLRGAAILASGNPNKAKDILLRAEAMGLHSNSLYAALEKCFKELEDFKLAYHYAVFQKK